MAQTILQPEPQTAIKTTTLQDFRLSNEFWSDFTSRYWNRTATCFRQTLLAPIASRSEMLQILKSAAAAYRSNGLPRLMEVYINGGKQTTDLSPYLVSEVESSLGEYYARINANSLIDEFTLSLYACQVYAPARALWQRARAFLEGLYSRVGLTVAHADLDVFIGNYRHTPAGIHRDDAANFSFVIDGCKEMLFWPPEAIRSHPNTRDHSKFAGCQTLRGEPGDIIFWPPQYWHMAVSTEGWSVTLNLALYTGRPFSAILSALASHKKIKSFVPVHTVPAAQEQFKLPEELTSELDVFQEVACDPSLADSVLELWARRVSAGGFASVPTETQVGEIFDDDLIRREVDFPIVTCPLPGGRLLIAVNGHAVTCKDDGKVVSLIRELNRLTESTVGHVLDLVHEDTRTRASIRKLLTQLESFGAFEINRK